MGDLIERWAAIDALEEIDCSDGVGINSLKCDAVDDAVTAIKALPSAQPGWIPVTKRLPEKDGQYYVTQLRYDVYDSKMTGAYVRETSRIWYSVRHKRWNVMANCKVVAWIEELPKPWEGENNG